MGGVATRVASARTHARLQRVVVWHEEGSDWIGRHLRELALVVHSRLSVHDVGFTFAGTES